MNPWRSFWCRIGRHKRLHVIQSFGSAKHVGCPDCLREFGMHDGLRAFLPWDGEIEQLYADTGYDVPAYRAKWHAWLKARALSTFKQAKGGSHE